jgi:hypothetical protein
MSSVLIHLLSTVTDERADQRMHGLAADGPNLGLKQGADVKRMGCQFDGVHAGIFRVAFKRALGTSPAAYRAQFRRSA